MALPLKNQIESVLFVAAKPISAAKLAELLQVEPAEVDSALKELHEEYVRRDSGIQLIQHASKVQLMSHPDSRSAVETYLKEEQFGELTKPGLETLTIVAYRGPIAKSDLEAIRGVNCSLILRNLMIKGLVEAQEDKEAMVTKYAVTFDFIRFLGVTDVRELPDYDQLSKHEILDKVVALQTEAGQRATEPPAPSDSPATFIP